MIVTPAPETLRGRAAEILAGSDYDWQDRTTPDSSWLLAVIEEILYWLVAPLRWLFELTEGLPLLIRWLVVVAMGLLLVLLAAHMIYSLAQAVRGSRRADVDDLQDHRRGPTADQLEQAALEAAERQDYLAAIRNYFRAALLRLAAAAPIKPRPGTTNRQLLKRYSNQPDLSVSLQWFVDTIDRKWYGAEPCDVQDWQACRQAHAVVCRVTGETARVLGA